MAQVTRTKRLPEINYNDLTEDELKALGMEAMDVFGECLRHLTTRVAAEEEEHGQQSKSRK